MKTLNRNISYSSLIIIGIVFAFIGIPMFINVILSTSNPTTIAVTGTISDWHNFWTAYISALISASIPFVILYKTIQNNTKENKSNRELQLKIFDFQQNQEWLKEFRVAAAQYVALYSYNDLIDVANVAKKDPYKAFYLIKDLLTRAGNADLRLSFIQRDIPTYQKLKEDKRVLFIFYNDVLYDIQSLLTLRIDNEDLNSSDILPLLTAIPDISEELKSIISDLIQRHQNETIINLFNDAIMTRIQLIHDCEEQLRDWFRAFINCEQERINSILINSDEQDK